MSNNENSKNLSTDAKEEFRRKKREIREQCFAILFEMSFTDDSVEDILDNAVESRTIVAEEFTTAILGYFSEHREEVDEVIKANIKGWTLNRLSKPTLSVLRLAVSELNCLDTPQKIVINEAVEIAKKYATPKEAAFVNGVLGSVVKK